MAITKANLERRGIKQGSLLELIVLWQSPCPQLPGRLKKLFRAVGYVVELTDNYITLSHNESNQAFSKIPFFKSKGPVFDDNNGYGAEDRTDWGYAEQVIGYRILGDGRRRLNAS